MNEQQRAAAEVTDGRTAPATGGASSHVWLWLREPLRRWWSVHATIHNVFGLTGLAVKEMQSRGWGLATIQTKGQGDDDDTWESCVLWTPMPIGEAISMASATSSRRTRWLAQRNGHPAYMTHFQESVEEPFAQFRVLLPNPKSQDGV